MKKRIFSFILTLIMLVSLVPAGAISASAASLTVSEKAITILKQLEGYTKACNGKGSITGYGTVCTDSSAHTSHNEKEADEALREELEDLDKAVNTFASRNGLSLSQHKHDALVLFSFENGTAWTTGTGDFQTAVKSGVKGSDFLSAICNWDSSLNDDNRRMIEANMYLNGVYSSSRPSRFIRVQYVPGGFLEVDPEDGEDGKINIGDIMGSGSNGTWWDILEDLFGGWLDIINPNSSSADLGTAWAVADEDAESANVVAGYMSEAEYQYYDTYENPVPDIVPYLKGYTFLGWYTDPVTGYQVTSLDSGDHGEILFAHWQNSEPNVEAPYVDYEINVNYWMTAKSAIRLYTYEGYPIIKYNPNDDDQKVAMYEKSTGTTYDEVDAVTRIPRGAEIQTSYSKDEKVGTVENGRMYVRYNGKKGWVETSEITEARRYEKSDFTVKGDMYVISEYLDSDSVRWGLVTVCDKLYEDGDKIAEYKIDVETNEVVERVTLAAQEKLKGIEHWIKLGDAEFSDGLTTGGSSSDTMDVTVTVTNTYVRVRSEDSIYSTELRKATMGEKLRIVNTSSNDGFLWGQIADANGKHIGWVALMYTNYESVKDQGKPVQSYNVIATATIVKPVNGYVNVRSDAGTDNQIVGALPYQTRVDLYEIKYVNGIQWGRYSGGWFCLAYAEVNGIDLNDYATNSTVLAYAFNGDLKASVTVYSEPSTSAEIVKYQGVVVTELDDFDRTNRTISNLTEDASGNTWGKITEGWVMVTDANGDPLDAVLDVAKYYTVVDGVTVRTAPATSADRVNNLVKGVEFNVNEKYQVMVIGDTIWGYADKVGEDEHTYSGWINLASKYVARGDAPDAEVEADGDEYTGMIGTIVGADKVNVRIHHATYSKILGKIARGTKVTILEEKDGWYKIDYDVDNNSKTDSWVVDTYVEVSKASSNSSSTSNGTTNSGSGTVETGLGIVANTYTGVNVRTAPGTGNPAVGKLLAGSTVEILEVTTYGASKWGRVAQGWICMDYVTMVDNYEILGALTGTSGSTSSSTAETAIYTGSANGAQTIYKTTSVNEKGEPTSDVVRKLANGDNVTVHEILTVKTDIKTQNGTDANGNSTTTTTTVTTYWARVNDGYILNPETSINLDTLDEVTYTVTESNTLNVRSGAGTGNGIEFVLSKGDQLTVTKVQVVKGSVWGFVEADSDKLTYVDEDGAESSWNWDGDGWISLAYCTKGAITIQNESSSNNSNNSNNSNGSNSDVVIGAGSSTGGYVTNTSGYRYTGKVINTDEVNVRATASTGAKVTTTLKSGAALVIYQTTIAENMAWGLCDAGWVYLYYVDLTPAVNGAVDARVVFNDNTIAYTDMNCSGVAGTYSRMSVVDIYEIVGKMARTELGWVNTDNLL